MEKQMPIAWRTWWMFACPNKKKKKKEIELIFKKVLKSVGR